MDATAGDTTEMVELELAPEPESVRAARAAVTEFAQDQGVDAEAVAVAVSEVVTNAVVHGFRDGRAGRIRVSAMPNGGNAILVVVSDDGWGMAPNPEGSGLGFGLAMVSSLSDRVEVESKRDQGTRLRMRFQRN